MLIFTCLIPGFSQHEANAIGCAPGLSDRLNAAAFTAMRELPPFRNNFTALEDGGFTAPTLVSGAGHDAMAMASLTQVGPVTLRETSMHVALKNTCRCCFFTMILLQSLT